MLERGLQDLLLVASRNDQGEEETMVGRSDRKLEASSDSGVRQARTIHQSAEQLVTMSTPCKDEE